MNLINFCYKDLQSCTFCSSPLPKNETITSIASQKELFIEGEAMNHCVYSRKQDALEGARAYYKVLWPQRGTFELTIPTFGLRNIFISELKLAQNQQLSRESWEHVINWLENCTAERYQANVSE